MATNLTSNEVTEKYNRIAPWYDLVEVVPELLGIRRLRRRLARRGSGKVLEVAIGTGKNLPYYFANSQIAVVDRGRAMLAMAQKRASALSANVSFLIGDAETLPFASESFDTVVSSLSGCTFTNPVSAFREMGRVCKKTGRVLLLEHGRSNRQWLARFQDRHADQFSKPLGCHWNRDPQHLAHEAGLKILEARRFFFGVFHLFEAMR